MANMECGASRSSQRHWAAAEPPPGSHLCSGSKEGALRFLVPRMLGTQLAHTIDLELERTPNSKVLGQTSKDGHRATWCVCLLPRDLTTFPEDGVNFLPFESRPGLANKMPWK